MDYSDLILLVAEQLNHFDIVNRKFTLDGKEYDIDKFLTDSK